MGRARQWIGEAAQGDSLNPEQIADRKLPDEAAALKALLRADRVLEIHSDRRTAADEAARCKKQHRGLSGAIILGGAVAALASGAMLAGEPATKTPATGPAPIVATVAEAERAKSAARLLREQAGEHRTVFIALQIAGLFTTAMAGGVMAGLKPKDGWRKARAKAEDQRIELVEAVLTPAAADTATDESGFPQAFEFFRRYQLELQLRYQEDKLKEIKQIETSGVLIGSLLGALATVSGLLGLLPSLEWAVFGALLGIAVPVLVSALRTWREVDGPAGFTATKAAFEQLKALKSGIAPIRTAAETGQVDVVQAYVTRVHDVIRVESGAWREVQP